MKNILMLLLLVSSVVQAQTSHPDGPVTLDAKAFREQSAKESNAVILDVRTPEEVKQGILPGAQVLNFRASDFAERLRGLDKDKTYFVYCKGGVRSSRTVELMQQSGFKHVHELKDGYDGWVKAGYPVNKP